MKLPALFLLCACALPALAAEPSDPTEKARAYVTSTLKSWAADPIIIAAVIEQNARHAGLTQVDIDALDLAWRAELGKAVHPMVDGVVRSAPSDFLRQQLEQAQGMITEAFVMDEKGLNVAASATTSDFWQGDEAKFTETFPKGPYAVHLGEVEFDESSQAYQIQVSFPLTNPADGRVIGAITVALNAEQL
ncbi:MAG: PDC sensor domain-containing protein [Paracoccaceae bacterium]